MGDQGEKKSDRKGQAFLGRIPVFDVVETKRHQSAFFSKGMNTASLGALPIEAMSVHQTVKPDGKEVETFKVNRPRGSTPPRTSARRFGSPFPIDIGQEMIPVPKFGRMIQEPAFLHQPTCGEEPTSVD